MTTQTQVTITLWLAMAIGGALGYAYLSRPTVPPHPVGPVVPDGNEHLRTIAALAASQPDSAKQIASAFQDFAAVLERSETQVATKGAFRSANLRFQQALWQGDPSRPQIPGISAAMNGYLAAKLGDQDGPFDAGARATAVAAIRDIVKAMGGG
jgi:hypothetical protein